MEIPSSLPRGDSTAPGAVARSGVVLIDGAGIHNPIKKKIDKLMSSRLHNDAEFLKMMEYVAPLVVDLDIHTERRLQRKLENRELELNGQYLEEFEKVNDHVQQFAEKVRKMHKICSDLTSKIQQNKEKTQHLLTQTSALQAQKNHLETKQRAIDVFLNKFSLSDSEKKALEGNQEGTIAADFFSALQRVKEIYSESKQLLRTSGEHSAALEIMVEMSQTMEKAYEVLYRSIQRECRFLSTDYVEMKGILCKSFSALQDREVLLKYSFDEFSVARKNQILRQYLDALTKGVHGGKPIELMSHDPFRYLGDMLAWIYEAVNGEKELFQLLLKDCMPEVIEQNSIHVLSQISSALCRPFKVRVEQVLASESECVTLYRLSALFNFYFDKLATEISADSELCMTINELNDLTLNIFYCGLNNAVQRILGKMGVPDYDLLPVPAVHQLLTLLREVLDSHDGSISSRSNAKEEFAKIFSCVLDPLYRSIQITATQLHSALDVAVYTLNCLSAIQSVVILYQFTDERLEMIKARTEANEDVLVSEGASAILQNSKMLNIFTKATAHDGNQGALSAISGMDSGAITRALANFDQFLTKPDCCQLDQIARISSARVRDSVRSRTMKNVVAAYSVIVEKLEDRHNMYGKLSFKSVDQVRELLK